MYTTNAQNASKRFIQNIKNGKIPKDTLPNSFEDYTEFYEDADFDSYKKYTRTLTYLDLVEKREVLYNGD